jgi:hypothetical protein
MLTRVGAIQMVVLYLISENKYVLNDLFLIGHERRHVASDRSIEPTNPNDSQHTDTTVLHRRHDTTVFDLNVNPHLPLDSSFLFPRVARSESSDESKQCTSTAVGRGEEATSTYRTVVFRWISWCSRCVLYTSVGYIESAVTNATTSGLWTCL